MSERRYTVAVDFDGVIHRYDTPWIDAVTIPDPPVDGAIEWLWDIQQKFKVVIFTTRAQTKEGEVAVYNWLTKHGGPAAHVTATATKPPALVYIDDRAWRFEGRFPTANEIHQAKPWHKLPAPPYSEEEKP